MTEQSLKLFRANERIFLNDNPRCYVDIDPNDFYKTLERVYRAANIPYTTEQNHIYDDVSSAFEEFLAEEAQKQVVESPLKETEEGKVRAYLTTETLNRLNLKTLMDTGEILAYRNGIYIKGGEGEILKLLHELGRFEITNSRRSEVLAAIRAQTGVDRSEFDKDPYLLNLRNGILNVITGEFREHGPDYLSLNQIPLTYDPEASCPNIIRFLTSTIEPEHLATVSKMLGYLLLRSARYQKAFMLTGEGSNGKSVFLGLLTAFLGKENVSGISLHELTMDRFASAELYGKMANVFADLRADKITDAGTFKVVVSGDRIRAQRKHAQPFTFEPYAKLIFSANQIPETADKSYAYFRRWVLLPFYRTFDESNRDEHLLEKLTTEEELSGLLNFALRGLKKLRDERGFQDVDLQEIRRQYELGASRIKPFIEEECILQPGNENLWIESAKLREAFKRYCSERGSKYIDESNFGEQLKALGVIHKQKRIGRERPRCEFGISLKCHAVTGNSTTYSVLGKDHNSIGEKEGLLLPVTTRQPENSAVTS